MYIEGHLKSGKTSFLAEKFAEIVFQGIRTSEILVLCQNSHKRKVFTEKAWENLQQKNIFSLGSLPVFTFEGIVYNTVKSYWSLTEELISVENGNGGFREIYPNLSGLELSELLIKPCLEKINLRENLEESLRDYQSYKSLKQQLLRRQKLIVSNCLTKREVKQRILLLKEEMGEQAQDVLDELRKVTKKYRVFDYLKQTQVFLYLLNTKKIDFGGIKYLFVDDFDETSYAGQVFVQKLAPHTQEFFIAADPKGGTRRGYLCAHPNGYNEIKSILPYETIVLDKEQPLCSDAEAVYRAILEEVPLIAENIANIEIKENPLSAGEMPEILVEIIKKLSFEGIEAHEITVVAPYLDNAVKHSIKTLLEAENINFQFLTGSKKIIDDPLVFGTAIILQLANPQWNLPPKPYEVLAMLSGLAGIPAIYLGEISETLKLRGGNVFEKLNNVKPSGDRIYLEKYNALISLINDLTGNKLKSQVEDIYKKLVFTSLSEYCDKEHSQNPLEAFNLMAKSLMEFDALSLSISKNNDPPMCEKEWVFHIKNMTVSDNPPNYEQLQENSLVIGTPQKVIDLEASSKIQIWLDVSNKNWTKHDTGPLYNAWVFSRSWKGKEYTSEIHSRLCREKTAAILRKLTLLCEKKIVCISNKFDSTGSENHSGIKEYLFSHAGNLQIEYDFTPRADQKAVFEYKSGKMAISAAPGAGKTKILEAFIIRLIQQGTSTEEILALTYMESAASNLRERIKSFCKNIVKLPEICTIHSLALGIIRYEDNCARLGISPDFEVCSESASYAVIKELYERLSDSFLKYKNFRDFSRSVTSLISHAKSLGITPQTLGKFLSNKDREDFSEMFDFFEIYHGYERILKDKNLLDYNDFLNCALKLLKEHPQILKYFQGRYKFIIEDEAQDSSPVQQEILTLLAGVQGNLIRCGDPNQSINGTFSNADMQGFVEFVKNAGHKVEMNCSQRSAKEVYELANSLVQWVENNEEHPHLKGAFTGHKIQGVEGKNPCSKDCLSFNIYETPDEEKEKTFQILKSLYKKASCSSENSPSIGVLLRGNNSVCDWANFLEKKEIPCICYSEDSSGKKTLSFLRAWLEVINNPWQNSLIKALYEQMTASDIIKSEFDALHFIETVGSPFVSFPQEVMPSESLVWLYNEIVLHANKIALPPEELILEISDRYFTSVQHRSNARVISMYSSQFRKNAFNAEDNLSAGISEVIALLKDLEFNKKLGKIKFFDAFDEVENMNDSSSSQSAKNKFIHVMTVHKAKGLEFDIVFMPEMQESQYGYPITKSLIKPSSDDRLASSLTKIKYKNTDIRKIIENRAIEQIHEHLRLIYVGITRAKKKLFMSANRKKAWQEKKDYAPSLVLKHFLENTPLEC